MWTACWLLTASFPQPWHMTWVRVYKQRVVNETVNFQFFVMLLHLPLAPRAGDFFLHNTFTLITTSLLIPSFSSHLSFCPLSIIGFYFQAAISVYVSCVCVSHPIFLSLLHRHPLLLSVPPSFCRCVKATLLMVFSNKLFFFLQNLPLPFLSFQLWRLSMMDTKSLNDLRWSNAEQSKL